MNQSSAQETTAQRHTIYVVSGGTGASGEQLARTVLAQFPNCQPTVRIVSHVRQPERIEQTVAEAAATGSTIVHTLVDPKLREALISEAQKREVCEIDLMGSLITHLADTLGQEPLVHPGLYRRLRQSYFDRVAAIEYTIAHDDGMRPDGWSNADAVLVGPSRVGKTPLCMYLAVLGWKAANVPLIPEVAPSPTLVRLDRRRVFGLTMDPGQLVFYRKRRQSRMRAGGLGAYTDAASIHQEIETAVTLYKHRGFTQIDVTDRPIETTADQIVDLITRRFGAQAHTP
jgi:regulator of PEP synthase PpsR (kinase-PPPase family)